MMGLTFLSAEWKHLILLNYAVPPDLLSSYVPPECDLDLLEGRAFLSLVAFQFLRTKVVGIPWPGFINFPEINLRFYIRHANKRGVCFVREYVPSGIVAAIARGLYNEPYRKAKMSMKIDRRRISLPRVTRFRMEITSLAMEVTGSSPGYLPAEDTQEHFFKEHNLGVGRDRRGRLVTYRCSIPVWKVFPVFRYVLSIDWRSIYGERFAVLQEQEPHSVCFAEGSPIKVHFKS